MKLAIMQPYIFPYIGYFQLMHTVDKFIVFDDVNYINKGWINRNRILVNGKDHLFTIPLLGASQNRLIADIEVSAENKWKGSFLKSIEMAYSKAPQFKLVFPLLKEIIEHDEKLIGRYIVHGLKQINSYLNIDTEMVGSSSVYNNKELKGQERILDICIKEKASHYVNPIGGLELYNKETFADKDIQLHFLKTDAIRYSQFKNEFIPSLSIIDVMMFNSQNDIGQFLKSYQLL